MNDKIKSFLVIFLSALLVFVIQMILERFSTMQPDTGVGVPINIGIEVIYPVVVLIAGIIFLLFKKLRLIGIAFLLFSIAELILVLCYYLSSLQSGA